ncbi:hypothetical protein TNCV_2795481 [Trichonephila clavipes]|nr:hypothetical protein TNCV_2795481 [Trichonephila clavipes]
MVYSKSQGRWVAMASYFVGRLFSRWLLKEIAFVRRIMDIKFCVHLGKSAMETYEILKYVKAVIHYYERKFLSVIEVSEKKRKVSNTANALDVLHH